MSRLERERAMVLGGTKLLFPLPQIETIDAENHGAAVAAVDRDLLALLLEPIPPDAGR